jgi:hypothetical protein
MPLWPKRSCWHVSTVRVLPDAGRYAALMFPGGYGAVREHPGYGHGYVRS